MTKTMTPREFTNQAAAKAKKEAQQPSFASKLHPMLEDSEKNLFFSPHSISSALGMCTAGAKGETLKALANLLEVPQDDSQRKEHFRSLVAEATVANKPYELTTANALWSQAGLNLENGFQETVANDYGGSFNEVDYKEKPDAAVEEINSWCNEKTRGKIPTIIQRDFINKDTRLILTNAIYFLGKWKKQFDKKLSKPGTWRDANDKTSQVPLMNIGGEQIYGETQEFKALDLPYQGDELSMLILLPEGSTGYIDNNLQQAYDEAVASLQYEEIVHVTIPSFTLTTEYKLGETLQKLGAGIAFSDMAEFDGITKDESLKISEVIHKAFVKCDEEGTEAAAATAVGMMRCASIHIPKPPIFRADHPFVFFIRNRNTNTILFAGRVTNP